MNVKNNIFDQCAEKFQDYGVRGMGLRVWEFLGLRVGYMVLRCWSVELLVRSK
ncbi:hypothetical protein SAMN05421594_0141 [Chryseobacterium oleae]|uniref:Uncharacterized protein n=1 Tax=Chryseobacterium oleae TaxID=491207 RepID=A0A1I4VCB5_CHROL|nr:hypothetical protein SAMN05421594_0141 [Chryseobacterium oleae]